MTPTYRADIDGLRAVAVLSVLLFHAGVETFGGGFVGVDIFFVISGYLITTIIHREVESGKFSLMQFYERRFRRILPAAAVLLIVVLVAGEFLFPLHHQDNVARSAVAATLFSSNIFFFLESGYFTDPAQTMPLLHTWSLAVEEQFYVAFPLVMLLIAKVGRRKYRIWLPALTAASLVTCVVVTESNASTAFFLSHTRAWELLVGGLLAINVIPPLQDQQKREFLSLAGLLMLAFSVLSFSELTIFPGLAVLLPVLGSALLIYSAAHGQTMVSHWLSARPLVFIGLISYSLYLWHWPVVAFAQYYSVIALTPASIIAVLCASFLLAVVSWRYIETPFRKKQFAAKPRQMFRLSAAATLIVFGIGIFGIYGQDTTAQPKQSSVFTYEENDPEWLRWTECQKKSWELRNEGQPCVVGSEGETPTFIFWGDSHGLTLASAIDRSAALNGLAGEIIVASGCPPLYKTVRQDRLNCDLLNTEVINYLSARDEIRIVIMAARWAFVVKGDYDKREESYPVKLIDLQATGADKADNASVFETGLRRTVEQLQELGKNVVLVGPVPEIGYDVPSATFVALKTNRDVDSLISPTMSEHQERNASVTALFKELQEQTAVSAVVQPSKYLCDLGYCRVAINNVPLYRDDNHLSAAGSRYLSPMFNEIFEE